MTNQNFLQAILFLPNSIGHIVKAFFILVIVLLSNTVFAQFRDRDLIPPTVSIAAPAAGSSVAGVTTLVANASDNVRIYSVHFTVDNVPVGEVRIPPYQVNLDTAKLSSGSHTLQVIARDIYGNQASRQVSFVVSSDNRAPSVVMVAPVSGANVNGIINVEASASDNVGIVGVQFQYDGVNIGSELSSSPYRLSIDTTPSANGTHSLRAIARDAAGNKTTSASISITVNNLDTTNPTVSLTSPLAGEVKGTIALSARAADSGSGIRSLYFYVDGKPLTNSISYDGTSFKTSFDTTSVANGSHTFNVKAYDSAGNSSSDSVTVNINNTVIDNQAPTVSITDPASGKTVSGVITVIASASDPGSNASGIAGVQFRFDGQNVGSEVTQSPYTLQINTTSAANGNHTLSAIARDQAGNKTTSSNVSILVNNADTVKPQVSLTAPANGETVNGVITLSADTSDSGGKTRSIRSIQFWINGQYRSEAISKTGTDSFSMSLDTRNLSNATHALTVVVYDEAGNSNSANGTINVHNADTSAPSVPTNLSATAVSPSQINLSWNVSSDNKIVSGYKVYRNNVEIATVTTTTYQNTELTEDTSYSYQVAAFDATNNLSSKSTRVTAKTLLNTDTTAPTVSITAPVNNASVTGSITVSADAADNRGVVGVQFKVDGNNLGNEDTNAPYSISLDTTTLSAGHHSLTAVARDGTGNTTSSPITIIVADTIKPTVTITSPTNASVAGIITLTANASDNVGVVGVQFKFDGQNLSNEDTSGPYSLQVDTTTALNGSHTLSAIARDAAGNTQTATLTINVNNTLPDKTPPTVTIITPANNATVNGTITISATAIDPGINASGIAGVQFKINGQNANTEKTSSPYSISVNTNQFANGNYTLTVEARDNAGNRATATSITISINNADITAPSTPTHLAATAISPNQINLSWNTSTDNIGIGYKIYRDTVEIATVTTTAYQNTGLTENTTYSYQVAAFDAANNLSTKTVSVSAKTPSAPDTTAPTVSITSPTSGNVNGIFTVLASANDNIGVVGVQFKFNNVNVGAEDTTPPYNLQLDTSTTTNGSHLLSAVARDAAGNTTTSASISITVNNVDTAAPSAPTNLSAAAISLSQINLSWSAATDNVAVTGYKIYRNNTEIASATTTSYQDKELAGNTTYSYRVAAFDAANNLSSKSVAVSTKTLTTSDTTPPQASIIAPATGSTISGTIPFSIDATDNVGIASVAVFIDGTLKTTLTKTPFNVNIDTTTLTNGTHELQAIAKDAAGNSSSQVKTVITVSNKTNTTFFATPSPGATLQGKVTLSVNSTITAQLFRVRYFVDGVHIGSTNIPPNFAVTWDTTTMKNGAYTLTAEVYTFASATLFAKLTNAINVGNIYTDVTAPNAPATLTAALSNKTGYASQPIEVTWAAVTDNTGGSGVAGYQLFRNNALITTTTSATNYIDGALTPQTNYVYEVTAIDKAGNVSARSKAASVKSGTGDKDNTPPIAMYAGAIVAKSSTTVGVSWSLNPWGYALDPVVAGVYTSGVKEVRIYRDDKLVGSSTRLHSSWRGASSSALYTDTGLTPNTTYVYKLTIADWAGNESTPLGGASLTTKTLNLDTHAPPTPTLTTSVTSTSQINLSWNAVTDQATAITGGDSSGLAGYRIYRNDVLITTITGLTYSDTGLAPNTTYTYKVTAVDKAGNASGAVAKQAKTQAFNFDFSLALAQTSVKVGRGQSVSLQTTANLILGTAQSVSFSVNALPAASAPNFSPASCAPPCSATLTVSAGSTTTPGIHTLTVTATGGGLTRTQTLKVQVFDLTAPNAPTNLQGKMNASTYVTLSWSAATDNVAIAGYKIYRNGNLLARVSSPTYEDWNVTPGNNYTYTVAAFDDDDNTSAPSAGLTLTAPATGGVLPEYWAGINKDGHWRNSNTRSIQGNLRLRWTKNLRDFHPTTFGRGTAGQRSNNLAVRDGKILLIVPSTNPLAGYALNSTSHYVTTGMYNLKDGALLNTTLTPHYGGGGLHAAGGLMDSDTPLGVINLYWDADGEVYMAHGSDHDLYTHFSAYTGEIPFASFPLYRSPFTGNASGYLTKTNSNKYLWAHGGSSGHSPAEASLYGWGGNWGNWLENSLKMYNSYALEGNWIYPYTASSISAVNFAFGTYWGTNLDGVEVGPTGSMRRWTYRDPNKVFVNLGNNHCAGAPRPYALGEDGRLYFYAYYTTTNNLYAIDTTKGNALIGVPTAGPGVPSSITSVKTRSADIEIATGRNATASFAQLATRDRYVAVYEPPRRLFIFDTIAKQLLHSVDLTTIVTQVRAGGGEIAPEQAVQLTIAGDSAYVVDPKVINGQLQLGIEQVKLASGTRTTTTLIPKDANGQTITVTNSSTVAMRELAAVDGALVALVDYDRSHQVLAIIEGDATPTRDYLPSAVISAPITGIPALQTLSDYSLATNQFDTGTPINFNSAGSMDPDGGALTYLWDFGDGATSTQANPSHIYASTGQPAKITNRTVVLTVTDNEGNTRQTTKVLAIRDIGNAQIIVLTPEADAYVDQAQPNNNFGNTSSGHAYKNDNTTEKRMYYRFNLNGINPATILSATFIPFFHPYSVPAARLWVKETSNQWSESSITWNNAPAPGDIVSSKLAFRSYPWGFFPYKVNFPVTEYVKKTSDKTSFVLTTEGNDNIPWRPFGRESNVSPQLVLIVGNAGHGAPQITNQPSNITMGVNAKVALSARANSALGASSLKYSWIVVSGQGTATFTANHSNAAQDTQVSFDKAGTYLIECHISDGLQTVNSLRIQATVK